MFEKTPLELQVVLHCPRLLFRVCHTVGSQAPRCFTALDATALWMRVVSPNCKTNVFKKILRVVTTQEFETETCVLIWAPGHGSKPASTDPNQAH